MAPLDATEPVRLATFWPTLHISFALIKPIAPLPLAYGALSALS